MEFLPKKLTLYLPYDSVAALLGPYPNERRLTSLRHTFTSVLFQPYGIDPGTIEMNG